MGVRRDPEGKSQGFFQLSPKPVGFCPLPRTFLELGIAEVQLSNAVTFHVDGCHGAELGAALRSEPRTAAKLLAASPRRAFGSAGLSLSISGARDITQKSRWGVLAPTCHCDTANQLPRDARQVPSSSAKEQPVVVQEPQRNYHLLTIICSGAYTQP